MTILYEPEIPTASHYEFTVSHYEITASHYEFNNGASLRGESKWRTFLTISDNFF
jgi:hypothetical protein